MNKVKSSWQNIEDHNEYYDSISNILDSNTEDEFTSRMANAKKKYRTVKAKEFLKKIELKKENLIHTYTSE